MENRLNRRFSLNMPVQITVLSGKRVARLSKISNISSGGISFRAAKEMNAGGKIEYIVTLSEAPPIQIRCNGKVLRIEKTGDDSSDMPYQITATIDKYRFVREPK